MSRRPDSSSAAPRAEPIAGPPDVWAIGTLPPPVTGMTLLTKEVVAALQEAGPVTLLDWSGEGRRFDVRYRLRRAGRVFASIRTLLAHGRVDNARLYLTCNSSRGGLLLTGMLVAVAARLGYCIYLHHHYYTYINKHDWRMAWIDRSMGEGGVHVVLAQQMVDDYRAQYATGCGFAIVCPSVVLHDLAQAKEAAGRPFCLGHLSNLSFAKGLDLVVETFRVLRDQGCDVRLKLAGPFLDDEAAVAVRQIMDEYPGLVHHVGPVHDSAKTDFLRQLDAFLFPTRNDAWPIVLSEAMSASLPVITFDRGCIRQIVGDQAGLVIAGDADFTSAAVAQIRHWMEDVDQYRAASRAAIAQATYLIEEGQRSLGQLVARIFSRSEPEPNVAMGGCAT